MKTTLLQYVKDLWGLFYPNICSGCDNSLMQQEVGICIECLYKMPKTNFQQDADNRVAQIFWGRVQIKQAFALYYYDAGGIFQKVIKNLKYKGDTIVGIVLGRKLAYEIKKTGDIRPDILVPVPLHRKKEKSRGYNQCYFIVKGMQEVLNIEINTSNLIRSKYTDSQTKLKKYNRWENIMESFKVKDSKLFEHKHILLVDDIITSGATMEACISTLLKCKGCIVSIACLGKAN